MPVSMPVPVPTPPTAMSPVTRTPPRAPPLPRKSSTARRPAALRHRAENRPASTAERRPAHRPGYAQGPGAWPRPPASPGPPLGRRLLVPPVRAGAEQAHGHARAPVPARDRPTATCPWCTALHPSAVRPLAAHSPVAPLVSAFAPLLDDTPEPSQRDIVPIQNVTTRHVADTASARTPPESIFRCFGEALWAAPGLSGGNSPVPGDHWATATVCSSGSPRAQRPS
jgi:hypothetical protein